VSRGAGSACYHAGMWLIFIAFANASESGYRLDWQLVEQHTRAIGPTLAARPSAKSTPALRAAADPAPVTWSRMQVVDQRPREVLLANERARLESLRQLKELLRSCW